METINDIVREMRNQKSDCPEDEKYEVAYSVADLKSILKNYADRFEAARKREADSIHRAMVLIAGIEMEDSENPPRLWTALEDAYDALCDALGTDSETTADVEEAKSIGRHFVVKPSGNAAKMREAILKILGIVDHLLTRYHIMSAAFSEISELGKIAEVALSAPPRNCELYTAEGEAYDEYLKAMEDTPREAQVFFETWLFSEAKGATDEQ